MLKKIIVLSVALSLCFSFCAFGYSYYEYDYETGEEKIVEISEEISLITPTHSSELIINDYNTLKQYSTYTILPGSTPGRITSLSTPYQRIMCLRLGRDYDDDGDIDNWALGTGFLVGPDLMLTAGHCMYGAEDGNVEEMRVHSLQNSTNLGSYCYPSSWITPTEFKNGDDNYDWCLVKLSKSLGITYGYFDVQIPTSNVSNVTLSGYPDNSSSYYFQYASLGAMYIYGDYQLRYTCSASGGQSGGPIFDTNSKVAYGIHSGGGTTYNYGTKISQRILNLIANYQ